jgi:hypothetical protein
VQLDISESAKYPGFNGMISDSQIPKNFIKPTLLAVFKMQLRLAV